MRGAAIAGIVAIAPELAFHYDPGAGFDGAGFNYFSVSGAQLLGYTDKFVKLVFHLVIFSCPYFGNFQVKIQEISANILL